MTIIDPRLLMRWNSLIVPMHSPLFALIWIPSRVAINRALWTSGLVLQCALVFAVFRRGIARRFPCFATLICFYPLRASLLLVLANRVDADVYNPLSSALTFTEILLQAAVVVELIWRVSQETAGHETGGARELSIRRAGLYLLIVLGVAGICTWLVFTFSTLHGSVDRVQLFVWFAMITLLTVVLRKARSANPVRIAAGFATFSLIQLAAAFGRIHAFARHDANWYLAWSYIPAVGYLAVVIFWLIALRKDSNAQTSRP
jgi:hypothetical protein